MLTHAMDYFFYPECPQVSEILSLPEPTAKHLRVLRTRTQARIMLINGRGLQSEAQILAISKTAVQVQILRQSESLNPQQRILAIAQLQDRERLEWLAEKATEIGIKALLILRTQRCLAGTLRPERLQKIMLSAVLQSQQAHIPELRYNYTLAQLFHDYPSHTKYLAHCNPSFPRHPLRQPASQALFIIGPEGDFSPEEIQFMLPQAEPISLGPHRLRAETAAIMALCR